MPSRRDLLITSMSAAATSALPTLAMGQQFGSGYAIQSSSVQGSGQSGGGAASLVKAPDSNYLVEVQNPPRPPQERAGYAIIGLGEFATKQILPAFADSARSKLSAVVTGDKRKGEAYAAAYGLRPGSVYGYDEIGKLKERDDIQICYVIVPNALHLTYAEAAAKAGKHVFTEKPMEISVERCDRMIRVCRENNFKLMVGYRSFYEPFNQEAIRRARSGELGRLVNFTSEHGRTLDPSERRDIWRMDKELAGGGALMDIGIYALSAAMYTLGEEPIELFAQEFTPKDDPRFREVEATIVWSMRFPSGALATCSTSYDWQETKRYSIIGSKGVVNLDPGTDYYKNRMETIDKEGRHQPDIKPKSQFAGELDHFSEAVLDNKPVITDGEMGRRDVALMMKIYESARTGKPVSLQ